MVTKTVTDKIKLDVATEEIGKATEGNQQAKGGEDGHKDGDGQDKLDVATEEIWKGD